MSEQITGEKSNLLPLLLSNGDHGIIKTIFQHSLNVEFPHILFHLGNAGDSLSNLGIAINDERMDELLKRVDVDDKAFFKNGVLYLYGAMGVESVDFSLLKERDLRISRLYNSKNEFLPIIKLFQQIDFSSKWGMADGLTPSAILDSFTEIDSQVKMFDLLHFLFGRGRGLTPSGDDMIVGFTTILIAYQAKCAKLWRQTLQRVMTERQTTDVSKAYLEATLTGYTSKRVKELLEQIKQNDLNELSEAILKVQKFGHTSGTDMLLGLMAGLIVIQRELS